MIKVLNIVVNGLSREGIVSTQLEYMKWINKEQYQIDIAAVHNNKADVISEFEVLGCRVVHFPDRLSNPLKYIISLYTTMKKEHYDVVHVHGSSSLLLMELLPAFFAGVKMRIAHSRNTTCNYKLLDKLLRPFFYRCYTKALACGNEAGEFLFKGRPFTILYNGKDFSRFAYSESIRTTWRKKLKLADKLCLGFVGNLNNQKNPTFLVDILRKVRDKREDVQLVIVGDGYLREKIVEYAELNEVLDAITFVGRVNNVNDLLQAMDIMLLPSLYEGLPNVVLEWQISGLQSFVSDKVTRECKATNLVNFLPIDEGAEIWADMLLKQKICCNRTEISQRACKEMKEKGFEIQSSCRMLEAIYSDK